MNQKEQPRPTLTRLEILIICVIVVIVLMLLELWHRQLVFVFCFGWIHYLLVTVGKFQFNFREMHGLSLAAVAFCGLVDCLIRSFRSRAAFAKHWQVQNSLMILPALLVSFTAGLAFVGAAHQIGWLTREPAILNKNRYPYHTRHQNQNQLRQIMYATGTYHYQFNTLPAGGTFLAHGIPSHSWQTSLLPYLNQTILFQAIDLDHSWLADKNKAPFSTTVPPYNQILSMLPKHDETGHALSHYAGNSHVLSLEKPLSYNQIKDGASNTLFAGESPAGFKSWGDPTNSRDPCLGLKTSPSGFGNPLIDSNTQFALVDGSVRVLNNKIDPKILKALATPDGGENLEDVEW